MGGFPIMPLSVGGCHSPRHAPRSTRHCERSEAIQESKHAALDCFVASLLAMTASRLVNHVRQPIRKHVCQRIRKLSWLSMGYSIADIFTWGLAMGPTL